MLVHLLHARRRAARGAAPRARRRERRRRAPLHKRQAGHGAGVPGAAPGRRARACMRSMAAFMLAARAAPRPASASALARSACRPRSRLAASSLLRPAQRPASACARGHAMRRTPGRAAVQGGHLQRFQRGDTARVTCQERACGGVRRRGAAQRTAARPVARAGLCSARQVAGGMPLKRAGRVKRPALYREPLYQLACPASA